MLQQHTGAEATHPCRQPAIQPSIHPSTHPSSQAPIQPSAHLDALFRVGREDAVLGLRTARPLKAIVCKAQVTRCSRVQCANAYSLPSAMHGGNYCILPDPECCAWMVRRMASMDGITKRMGDCRRLSGHHMCAASMLASVSSASASTRNPSLNTPPTQRLPVRDTLIVAWVNGGGVAVVRVALAQALAAHARLLLAEQLQMGGGQAGGVGDSICGVI
jgi:hypothetical protein